MISRFVKLVSTLVLCGLALPLQAQVGTRQSTPVFYPSTQKPFVEISGHGKVATEIYEIPKGAYRIDATVKDNAFILHSVVVDGDCEDESIFNEVNFDVSQLVLSGIFISQGCSVLFETDNVDGQWSLAFRDILSDDAMANSLAIDNGTKIKGTGIALTMPTNLSQGIWRISASIEDNAFILHTHVIGDCDEGSVFNELDFDVQILEASAIYRVPEDGCTVFWDTSNVEGNWELTFEKIR